VTTNTTELQRSTLERKDRTELHTIAVAMGGKPGSRARKAEIVDLILGLAGIEETPPGGNGDAAAAQPAPETGAPEAVSSEAVSPESASSEAVSSEAVSSEKPDEASATDEPSRDQKENQGRNQGQKQGQGQNQNRQQGKNRGGNQGGGNEGGGNQGGGNQNRGDNQGGGNQTDAGNRKRRRRGRDRDRDTDRAEEAWQGDPVDVEGYLDLRDEGYGFLRVNGSLPSKDDVYVSVKQARQFSLRPGDQIKGGSRPANRNEKNPALLRIDTVNDGDIEAAKVRPKFENLTPLFPDEKLQLERPDEPTNMTSRIVDLIAPIGKGQRGLIVSPPKAGKTTIMKEIAHSIEANNPEVKLLVLLVDERPEEVTDMKRWLKKGEVVASTFDRPSDEHTAVAELTIERAKRMVEVGEDVVIILDGITRLARAYNLAAPATGRIMSGGVDSGALYPPKRFFGAARNVEEGGSLTILATALVETGSKMDEVIFEEFKGTGNMELRLDRKTAERRIYPAIDVDASSTRHEELLFERKELQQVWKLRRVLSGLANDGGGGGAAGLELLIDRLKTFPTNSAFLDEVARGPVNA
jgi:transcription termination factor Rho